MRRRRRWRSSHCSCCGARAAAGRARRLRASSGRRGSPAGCSGRFRCVQEPRDARAGAGDGGGRAGTCCPGRARAGAPRAAARRSSPCSSTCFVVVARPRRRGRPQDPFLLPLARDRRSACRRSARRTGFLGVAALAVLSSVTLDLTWHADHQDRKLRWRARPPYFPPPAPSARFLLARQAQESPFRFATSARPPVLHHQLGGAGTPGARALLLDSESVRLGLEDVAGYNPVHLKTLQPLHARLERRHGGRPSLRVRRARADSRLRALGVRYYVSPPGQQPKGLPVVYRDALAVITRDPHALPLARVARAGTARRKPATHRAARARPRRHRDGRRCGPAGARRLRLPRLARHGRRPRRARRDSGLAVPGGPASARECTVSSGRSGPLSLRLGLWVSIAALVLLGAPPSAGRARGRRVSAATGRLGT